jgi:peptidoglycan/LPS O-acetylase OafA/YrhL
MQAEIGRAVGRAGPSSGYRADIDGLRAIAVLSVIAFHLDPGLLPGGFVGVDIFFVISGFLISLHILEELDAGRFSVAEFYRRRIKRIAPVMLVVTALTLLVSQLVLIPDDAQAAARSAFWSVLSLANVHFYLADDQSYFAAATNAKPLLHLWSLGVEEQFYFIWPLLLLLVWRPARSHLILAAAAVVAMASFVAGEIVYPRDPSFVYYMLPMRAGELVVGGITAVLVLERVNKRVPPRLVAPLAVAGLLLIGASLVLLNEEMVFPGLRAIIPTLGASLLLFCGSCSPTWPSKMLAPGPLVWVGLRSYSAYLWHWPLIAFYRYGHSDLGFLAGGAIFALTMILAGLSYRLIEQPARHSKASFPQIFAIQYAVPGGVLMVLAFAAVKLDGLGPRWLSPAYRTHLAAVRQQARPAYDYPYVCQRQRLRLTDIEDPQCVLGSPAGAAPQALLWGDSNAAHYVGVIGAIAEREGFRFRNVAVGSCPPIFADPAPYIEARRLRDCRDAVAMMRPVVDRFPVIIISAAYTGYQSRSPAFLEQLFATARGLARGGKVVIVIGKVPSIAGYDRLCREKALSYPLLDCPRVTAPPPSDVTAINERLRAFAEATPNVRYFDLLVTLCAENTCSAFDAAGDPLYYDPEHLSMQGSWEIGRRLVDDNEIPLALRHIGPPSPLAGAADP